MDQTLRCARLDDFAGLRRLYAELVGDSAVPDGAAGRQRLADILSIPGTEICMAERGGQPVGMATLHVMPNLTFHGRPYAFIENVATLGALQGQGIGRSVMEFACKRAWRADAYKIMLLTGQSTGAKGFYEKLGFRATEKHGMTLRRAPPRNPKA
ncbi:MAG: GNAT family N-acetyltransferase [Pseudomonadota bacterium]